MDENMKGYSALGNIGMQIYLEIKAIPIFFPGSKKYWEDRYAAGGSSGAGSYDKLALFKAKIINNFVKQHGIRTVIEFGCGDGNQLKLADYPLYLGYDVSGTAISLCKSRFSTDETKQFKPVQQYRNETADLSLSLDVIYHLVEDEAYKDYMHRLFKASRRFVIIYSSNTNKNSTYKCAHIKHRKFTEWIERNRPQWNLQKHIPNKYPYNGDVKSGSFSDFYIFEKLPAPQPKLRNKLTLV